MKKIIVCTTPTCTKCRSLHKMIDSIKDLPAEVEYLNIMDGSDRSKSILDEYNLMQVPFVMFINESGIVYETVNDTLTKSDILRILNI